MAKATRKKKGAKQVSVKTSKGKNVRFQLLADAAYVAEDSVAMFEAAYRARRGPPPLPRPDPVFTPRTRKIFKRLLFRSTDKKLNGGTTPWPINVITETIIQHGNEAWDLVKSEKTGRRVNLEQLLDSLETIKQKRCPPDGGRGPIKIFGFVCDF